MKPCYCVGAAALAAVSLAWLLPLGSRFPAPTADGGVEPVIAPPNDAVLARIARKQEVARAVTRRELTLDQAASRYARLNADDPGAVAWLRHFYPNADEGELVYRQVIHFVYWERGAPPEQLAQRIAELQAEFRLRYSEAELPTPWMPAGARAEKNSLPPGAPIPVE